jgi:hypothetical protein
MAQNDDRLTRFFGGGEDDQGRTFDTILGWDDARFEMVHDYIQWIFPLPERSGANPWAPVLDAQSISAIRSSPDMQDRLRLAFQRMLAFYGFTWHAGALIEGPHFAAASQNWLHAGNHNHLRLTRMLRSLRVLGLEGEAAALWAALRMLYERERAAGRRTITEETFAFWRQAAL